MQKGCFMSTTDPTFAYITYLFFSYLLADEGPRETSKMMLFSAKKAAN